MADFNGDMRKTLIKTEMQEPRAIAVYPSEGWMFWTDWGQRAKIERAGMDGNLREVGFCWLLHEFVNHKDDSYLVFKLPEKASR